MPSNPREQSNAWSWYQKYINVSMKWWNSKRTIFHIWKELTPKGSSFCHDPVKLVSEEDFKYCFQGTGGFKEEILGLHVE